MYSLISPNSQNRATQDVFSTEYQTVQTALSMNALDVEIVDSTQQGTTVAFDYNVIFHTDRFGDIPDPDRTIRLIETADGWRVAWSRMDILAGYVEGSRLESTPVVPARGNIYDRNGNPLAQTNGTAVAVYMTHTNMQSESGCLNVMSRILHREYQSLDVYFSQFIGNAQFLAGVLDPDVFASEQRNIEQVCGTVVTDEYTTRRYYRDLAAHIVGYIGSIQSAQMEEYARRGYPQDALVGQDGIEFAYETELAGVIGGRITIVSPTGETLRALGEVGAVPGQDIYLTIDRDLQYAVQEAFVEAYNVSGETWAKTSNGAAAVVFDIQTGEVLAIASHPDFSQTLFMPGAPYYDQGAEIQRVVNSRRTPLLNRATMGVYPAGSIFKMVSLIAGLDSGVYSAETTTNCTGIWDGRDRGDSQPPRTDWKEDGHGDGINAHLGLMYSCDPYFWDLGVALHNADPGLLPRYAEKLGLGVLTGLDRLPENEGSIPRPATMADTLNNVIGQGDTQITPLQIVRMTAAIANGGTLYTPHIVRSIQAPGALPTFTAQPDGTQLDLDSDVLALMRESMCDVTSFAGDSINTNAGTAYFVFGTWYDEWLPEHGLNLIVCGKTGTAQTGGATTKPQAWFTAFFPADNPQIAISVIVENSCEGSEVAAPIVRRIVEDYYGIPHSELPPLWQEGCVELGE
jgi:penicillin-binding protein 2